MITNFIRKLCPRYESKKEMTIRFERTVQDLQKQLAFKEGRSYMPIQVIQDRKDAFEIALNHVLDDEPIDYIKDMITRQMAFQLTNVITWDVVDADTIPRKVLIGRLFVQLRKEDPFR